MPGFDGTGPMGIGPMTGGGRGFCGPWSMGARMPYYGRGRAPYRPYGMPWGSPYYGAAPGWGAPAGMNPSMPVGNPAANPYAPQMGPENELDLLYDRAQTIKGELEQIESRIRELEGKEG